jgi:hypothetical protein
MDDRERPIQLLSMTSAAERMFPTLGIEALPQQILPDDQPRRGAASEDVEQVKSRQNEWCHAANPMLMPDFTK